MTNFVLSIDFNPGKDTLWFLKEGDTTDAIALGAIENGIATLVNPERKTGNFADLVPLLPDFISAEIDVTLFAAPFGDGWDALIDGVELAIQTYDPAVKFSRGSEILAVITGETQSVAPAANSSPAAAPADKPTAAPVTEDDEIDWMTGKPRLKVTPSPAAVPAPSTTQGGQQASPTAQTPSPNVTPTYVANPIPGVLTAQGNQVPVNPVSIDWALMMTPSNAFGSYTHSLVLQPVSSSHQGVPALFIGYCDLRQDDADIEDSFQAMLPGVSLLPVPATVTYDGGSDADEMIYEIQERLADFFGVGLEAKGVTYSTNGPITFTTVSPQIAGQTGASAQPTTPGQTGGSSHPPVTQPGQIATPQPATPAPPPVKDLTAAIDDLVKIATDNPAILESLAHTPGLVEAVKAKLPKPKAVEPRKSFYDTWDRGKIA